MPIWIDTGDFTDVFGNILPFYKSDAGDILTAEFRIRSHIYISSEGNPLTPDFAQNTVQSGGQSWIEEGFRVGMWVMIRIHSNGGPPLPGPAGTNWAQVVYVDAVTIDLSTIPYWYNLQNGEFATLTGVVANGSSTPVSRDELDIQFNHVKNSSPGGPFSLIDAEVSQLKMSGLAAMIIGATVPANFVGVNRSGGFVIGAEIERVAPIDFLLHHKLRVTFINPGLYDDGSWFFSSECLKIFNKLLWAVIAGEPFERSTSTYNLQANTGGFDEPYNEGLLNSSLVLGTNEIDYCIPTTFDVTVDGPLTEIGVGSMYLSIDDAYFRNRPFSQQEITMAVPTVPAVPGLTVSFQNEFGAGYDLLINSVVPVGSETTINITITPNAAFQTFIDGREEGDRLFKLWVKCGNLNLLAFCDQLTCDPPVGGPLIMVDDFYLDHSENVTIGSGVSLGYIADTEDDVGYLGTFVLDKNVIQETFSAKFEAFNSATGEDFTLSIASFSFAGVQISGAGVYLLNESISINSSFQTTSEKINALLVLEPSLDTPTEFGVKIFFPILSDWRYWLAQLNADVDFYPTQDHNWEQYDNLGDWELRTELILIRDGLAYVHDNVIVIEPYDNEVDIDSTIELLEEPGLTVVGVAPSNSIMRIRATHVNLVGGWGPSTWGQITVEPFESGPRTWCSSAVPFDNNTSNPLSPLVSPVIIIDFPTPDVAVLECAFDTSLINLNNGIKISAKIKDPFGFEFLLDFVKEAEWAVSTAFKLSPDIVYAGPAMKVRRSFDGAVSDIPNNIFNQLDQVFLLDFVTLGGVHPVADGFIHTLYDYSGNGINAEQLTLADQAPIVTAGVVNVDPNNGLPAGIADGVNHHYDLTAIVVTSQTFMNLFVFTRAAAIGQYNVGISSGPTFPWPFIWDATDRIWEGMGLAPLTLTVDASVGNFLFTTFRDAANLLDVRKNSVSVGTAIVAPVGGTFAEFLRDGAGFHDGPFQECVQYLNDLNLTARENNVKTRYNIP